MQYKWAYNGIYIQQNVWYSHLSFGNCFLISFNLRYLCDPNANILKQNNWGNGDYSPESSNVMLAASVGAGAGPLGLLRPPGAPPTLLGSPQEPTYVDL